MTLAYILDLHYIIHVNYKRGKKRKYSEAFNTSKM